MTDVLDAVMEKMPDVSLWYAIGGALLLVIGVFGCYAIAFLRQPTEDDAGDENGVGE